jgi:hypothetical protein
VFASTILHGNEILSVMAVSSGELLPSGGVDSTDRVLWSVAVAC